MLLNLLGWFYIVLGILFFFRPEKLRNKFKKMTMKKLRLFFFTLALVVGLLLIKATWGLPGFLAKLFLVIGFIAIIKALYLLKGKTAEALLNWWLAKDVNFFRLSAIAYIVVGGLLLSI